MAKRKTRETSSAIGWISKSYKEAKSAMLGSVYDRIDRYRPYGLSAHGKRGERNDGNDAWRHGMLSGLLTLKSNAYIAKEVMTTYEVVFGEKGSIESNMDYYNNPVGIAIAKRYADMQDLAEPLTALGVVSGIASGDFRVQDRDTKILRESSYRDIPRYREPFKPESDHNDFRGGAEGLDA